MDSTMNLGDAMISAESVLLGGMLGFFTVFFIVIAVITIISIVANWKIFSKAGEHGWACIVPIYANVVQFKVVGLSPWLLLLYLVPIVNMVVAVVFAIMVPFRLAKSFGKDLGWGFGLWLLPFIFNLILAFGSSQYVGPNGETQA